MEMLATFLRDGGVFMYLILAVSIVGVAIAIERIVYLIFKYSINGEELWKMVRKDVQAGDIEKARSLARSKAAPLAMILDSALVNYGKGEREIQNAIDEVSLEVIPKIERRISYLAMLANISTLLGLLGTIQGLVQAFAAVGIADPAQKAGLLASGISIALYTTAFGLLVAIPLLIVYSLLQSKSHRIIDEIDEFSVKIINFLIYTEQKRRAHAKETGQQ